MTEDPNHEQELKRKKTRQILFDLENRVESNAAEPGNKIARAGHPTHESYVDTRFLSRLASTDPTPAGGSAAAYAGAMAAALLTMVARITACNPNYSSIHARMLEVARQSEKLQGIFTLAVEQDDAAYRQYMAARRLPDSTPQECQQKKPQLEKASREIIRLPLELASKCLDLLDLSLICLEHGSFSTICDSRAASLLAESALRACSNNVLFNLQGSQDKAYNAGVHQSIGELLNKGDSLLSQIQEQFSLRTKTTK